MSELDKIKECLDFFCRRCNEQGFYSPPLQPIVKEAYEAIAALRAEPVAWAVTNNGLYVAGNIFRYKPDAQMCMDNLNRMHPQEARTMVPLYAPPSRETDQRSATKTQEGLGRLWNVQQEQRESSGIRIEGSQSPGSNPAPMHGQSKTGLTESHSGAPTLQRSEAEQESKGSGSPLIAPAQSSDHPTAEPALSAETTLSRYKRFTAMVDDESPLERLRFFCSLAMNGQDWIDVEPFFDAVALSSLTARDEGIEAAAKVCDELAELPGNQYETAQAKLCARGIRAYGKSMRMLKGASHD